MELDVALVVNSVSDRRECAQHRLPELKACGMLLQSIVADATRGPRCLLARPLFVRCLKGLFQGPKGLSQGCPRGGAIENKMMPRHQVECRVTADRRWSQPGECACKGYGKMLHTACGSTAGMCKC